MLPKNLPISKGCLLGLLFLVAVTPATAQGNGPFTVSAGYTVQSDSNLFRLPAEANTNALLGRSGDEKIGIATLGLGFKSQQSLQGLEANVSVSNYQYQNFDYLNYTAADYDLKWLWAFTPRLTGSLVSDRKETQNSFADVTQGDTRKNVRIDASTGLEANYEVDGPWRLVAGLSTTRQSNQEAAIAGSDYGYTTADLGVRYVFPSGSSMTYLGKLNNGNYFNATFPNDGYFDNSYKQFEHDFRLHWTWSGLSTADVYATHLERNHPNYPSRDFSGWNTGASIYYAASGKLSVMGSYRHELAVYATGDSNYTQTDHLTVIPTWQIGPKTSLKLQFDTADIQYVGTPSNAVPSQRRDRTRDTSLSLTWQPTRQWLISSGLQNLTRNSNLANLDYESSVLFLAGQFTY
jgi:exopolysaccharide biosynthesis operon protein EpsL